MPELHIQGKEGAGRWENEADKVTASRVKPVYESREFAVPGGGYTDQSVATALPGTGNPPMFQQFARAHTVIIRTDADISIKLNDAANDSISLRAAEGVLTLDIVEMTDIFITAPATANIKILLV